MSRVIKFRAWGNQDEHAPAYMDYFRLGHKHGLLYCDGCWHVATGYDGEDNPLFLSDNIPSRFTLMQFTGLLDRDGKEVFEGDVVEGHSDGPVKIVWRTCGWECDFADEGNIGIDELRWLTHGRIWVIGNIYENPELFARQEAKHGD